MIGMVIVVAIYRVGGRSVGQAQASGDASQGFSWAEEGVVVGRMAD